MYAHNSRQTSQTGPGGTSTPGKTDDNTYNQIDEDDVYVPTGHDYSQINDEDINGSFEQVTHNENHDDNENSSTFYAATSANVELPTAENVAANTTVYQTTAETAVSVHREMERLDKDTKFVDQDDTAYEATEGCEVWRIGGAVAGCLAQNPEVLGSNPGSPDLSR
ncbi:Hypp539 [Branchiostoma lanceolatum]|uniref:Hypp539 protein n=1 Tax=Branchiostoma lanceolatum TaxID=7740 RepID=A0A8J9VB65_BRALA|nr:Hypp539 [Branchiostoma lanceolatum]